MAKIVPKSSIYGTKSTPAVAERERLRYCSLWTLSSGNSKILCPALFYRVNQELTDDVRVMEHNPTHTKKKKSEPMLMGSKTTSVLDQ